MDAVKVMAETLRDPRMNPGTVRQNDRTMQIRQSPLIAKARRRRVRFSYPANFKNDVLSSLQNSSPRKTATMLGVSLSTLYRWRQSSSRQPGQEHQSGANLTLTNSPISEALQTTGSIRASADPLSKHRYYRYDRSSARNSRHVLERLMRVHEFIEDRYFERVDCDALASIAGMSKCHFVRVYKQAIGQSPYQHLIRRRAAAALSLMGVTLQPTLAIACAVGFESTSSLIKALKKFSTVGIPKLIY
jgi:AraC-like DNA-binding protein